VVDVVVDAATLDPTVGTGDVDAAAGAVEPVKLTTGVVETVGFGSSWKIRTATSPTITIPMNDARPINQSVLPSSLSGGRSGSGGGDQFGVAKRDGSIEGAG
jgi:hypothetical protein